MVPPKSNDRIVVDSRLTPHLAIAGAMIATDRICEIQVLAWPVLVALAICAALSSNCWQHRP